MVRSRAILLAALLAAYLSGAGCTSSQPRVTSYWPVASSEATVAAPPDANKWPLTGLWASSVTSPAKHLLSVAIGNSASFRPQMGVGSADVVYEWLSVDGGTELNGLFQSSAPALIGPLGSAGKADFAVCSQYSATPFARELSGASAVSPDQARQLDASQQPGTTKSTTPRGAPFGAYLVISKAYEAIRVLKTPTVGAAQRLRFDSVVASGQPISSVEIPFSASETVTWTYRKKAKGYVRQDGGRKHVDAATRKQVSAKNVVVMWVQYADVPGGGSPSYAMVVGTGQVSVFRDGVKIDGRWKASADSPPRFTLEDGTPIALAPGNSWFEAIPLSMNITMK